MAEPTYTLIGEATVTSSGVTSVTISNLGAFNNASAFIARMHGKMTTAGDIRLIMNSSVSAGMAAKLLESGRDETKNSSSQERINFESQDIQDVFYVEFTILEPGNSNIKNIAHYLFGAGIQEGNNFGWNGFGAKFDTSNAAITSLELKTSGTPFDIGTNFKVWSLL